MKHTTLQEMVKNLSNVSDINWGMYAFSRDPLKNKVSDSQKKEMIEKAISCGRQKAVWAMEHFGTNNPKEIAKQLGLEVNSVSKGQIADRVLFALFTPPNTINIMEEPIKKAVESLETMEIVSKETIYNLILGHEIFHFLEEEDENIYTRTEKIVLWNLLGIKNRSTIRALSEIARMYFSLSLTSFPCSPFALDVILYYNYNIAEATKIYNDIMQFS